MNKRLLATTRVLLLTAAAAAVFGCSLSGRISSEPPLVPRLESAPAPRVVTEVELLDYGRRTTPQVWINVAGDRLPNDLALAMAPLLVDWNRSRLEGDDAFVLMHNVSVRGNPIEGRVLFATIRVPLAGIRSVEWCNVITRNRHNRDTLAGHGQTRFIFDPDRRPVVLDEDGNVDTESPYIDDLILSWEAWRTPSSRFDMVAALSPDTYSLTLRAFSGAQRLLFDTLRNNPWRCYPLALPDTADAMPNVLVTNLEMGDAFARRVVHRMIEDGQFGELEPDRLLLELSEAELEQVRNTFSLSRLPDDPLIELMGRADLSYQLLERSCITQSLLAIQLALRRTYVRHELGPPPQLRIVPDRLPPWIDELATGSASRMLYHAPGLLLFIARNQQVLPGRAHTVLDEAGVLRRENGAPLSYYYHIENSTPYGRLGDNMM